LGVGELGRRRRPKIDGGKRAVVDRDDRAGIFDGAADLAGVHGFIPDIVDGVATRSG